MSTKRRVGVSAATPVPCWEKVWIVPENAPAGSTLKVLSWAKTAKIQHFSDDEGEVDEPLVPLPDDVEVVDGDEEADQEEPAIVVPPPDAAETAVPEEEAPSKPASPKPQLSMGLQPSSDLIHESENNDELDASLKVIDTNMEEEVGVGEVTLDTDGGLELDISSLGPDGLGLETAHDLTQLDADDALLGGPLQMDESLDPFGEH
ncbi:hypothetical protein C8J57DRAFT_1268109 [Mycena rebaudengoi]|nr:hypothetical protein C8J57DRAFT_1268109 [Mycena rebaudengoi]